LKLGFLMADVILTSKKNGKPNYLLSIH